MTTVTGGTTATYTFTSTQSVAFTVDNSGERALVQISRAGNSIYGDNISSNKTIGPFLANDVMNITALSTDIDYTLTSAAHRAGATYLQSLRANAIRDLNKAPLIQAPVWTTGVAMVSQQVRRHSNGELMQAVNSATTGATEPTWSSTALMTDGTVNWISLGRRSRVNADGYPVPTVTTGTSASGLVETLLYTNSSKFLSPTLPNLILAGGPTSQAWLFTDGGTTSAQGLGVGLRGQNRVTVIRTDAPKMAWSFWNQSGLRAKIYVDDYPIEEDPTLCVTGNPSYHTIDWGGVRREREYRIEQPSANNLRGVMVAAQDALYAPQQYGPLGVYTCDSYGGTLSTYTTPTIEHMAERVGRACGIRYLRNMTLGGTGYVATNGNLNYSELQKVQANPPISWPADVVWCVTGINDVALDLTAATQAARQTWAALRSQYPTAVIIIADPWVGSTGPGANHTTLAGMLQSAFSQWGDPLSGYIYSLSSWVTGTGKWGTVTGTGNADFYIGSDGIHPSGPGCAYYITRMAAASNAILDFYSR